MGLAWDEAKHPRDRVGKFTEKGNSGAERGEKISETISKNDTKADNDDAKPEFQFNDEYDDIPEGNPEKKYYNLATRALNIPEETSKIGNILQNLIICLLHQL